MYLVKRVYIHIYALQALAAPLRISAQSTGINSLAQ